MLKITSGMVMATILLGIGFHAGRLTVPSNDALDFNRMLSDTAAKMSLPVKVAAK